MKKIFASGIIAAALTSSLSFDAMATEMPDTFLIPEHALTITGDRHKGNDLIGVIYNPVETHFNDPKPPRFLFLDSEGKVALGIGGNVKGTLLYDFDGAIDNGPAFSTFMIPVPNNPAQKNQFYGTANHSTIFLQLVGRSKLGYYQMYVQTQFVGDGYAGYGLKLKQAWMGLGNVKVGLAPSTFVDQLAGTPTIDDYGPIGENTAKNVLIQYRPQVGAHLTFAISAEVPDATYTTDADLQEKINQRFPDIPAFVQYQWQGGQSHVRLTGLFRNLSYRDLVAGKNKFVRGWAVQLSGLVNMANVVTLFYQGAYGRGYGRYINDLSGNNFDLVPDGSNGLMKAPRTLNYELGLRVNLSSKAFLAGSYSQARVFDWKGFGNDGYKYGQYVSTSFFYYIMPSLEWGLEYLHGVRNDFDGQSGHANRINTMIKFNF
ncbi:MAG: porin [Paramuribaculum sp.]|nr:porin [Paramuribaculum sp.]